MSINSSDITAVENISNTKSNYGFLTSGVSDVWCLYIKGC